MNILVIILVMLASIQQITSVIFWLVIRNKISKIENIFEIIKLQQKTLESLNSIQKADSNILDSLNRMLKTNTDMMLHIVSLTEQRNNSNEQGE